MRPLLVLVDLQEDYLSSTGLEPATAGVLDNTRRLLNTCRRLAVPVAHVWTSVNRQTDNRMQHWKQAGLWMCEEGTPGHATPPVLAPVDGEAIVHKSGYSGFEESCLHEIAASHGADTLLLCGVHMHACIRQTILDALQADLRVVVAQDAVGSYDPLHAVVTRQYLEARAVRFDRVNALIQDLGAHPHEGHSAHEAPVEQTVSREVERAAAFLRSWQRKDAAARVALVERLAEVIGSQEDSLARHMAREIGKPLRFGRAEVRGTVEMLYAIAAHSQHGETTNGNQPVTVRRRPHGIVGVITPWNNPIYIPLGKIVPAVVHGNTVAWKPAPEARGLSKRLMELLGNAAWPEGLVRRIDGGRYAGEALMNATVVSAVTITGSSAAGYAAQAICARRRIPLQAELGGNNASIVMPDADLNDAARQIAAGAFEQAGQRCTANSRVIVDARCRDAFLELLMTEAAALSWGDPSREETQVGPMINSCQRDRVAAMVERAVVEGVEAVCPLGDEPPDTSFDGAWYPPVILNCGDDSLEIVQEEIFGPVLVVQTAHNWNEAIAQCNGVRQGLAASVFTDSDETARNFLDAAEAGILKVNQSTASAAVDAPFGGWKTSGIGPPEHGEFDRAFYTRPQTVYSAMSSADVDRR